MLDASNVESSIVVSSETIDSSSRVWNFRKNKIIQESLHHGGVNSAVQDGVSLIRRSGDNPKILVLPSDLPLAASEPVNKILELLNVHDLVINPSFRKDGTNLLAFRLSNVIPFYYDHDSYSNHAREAQERKLDFLTIDWKEFSIDVDSPEDLQFLMRERGVNTLESLIGSL